MNRAIKQIKRPDDWLNNNVPMYTNNSPAYSSYTQCLWNANGELVCNKIPVKYNPNESKNYIDFKDFSTPTKNYNPTAYRKDKEWYESNQQGDCDCLLNNKQGYKYINKNNFS